MGPDAGKWNRLPVRAHGECGRCYRNPDAAIMVMGIGLIETREVSSTIFAAVAIPSVMTIPLYFMTRDRSRPAAVLKRRSPTAGYGSGESRAAELG